MRAERWRNWANLERFYGDELWAEDLTASRPPPGPATRTVRLVIAAALAFRDRMLNLHAMGLVYTTLLSLVPFLAVTFSVLKAFGAQYRLEPVLARVLAPLGPQAAELTQRVVEFVTRMNVGVLGAIGVAGLFYTAVSLIGKVEDALNDIWHVRESRGLRRKFSDYLSVLLVGPVLIFAAFALIASLRNSWLVQRMLEITRLEAVTVFVGGYLAPFVLLASAFTFVYRCLPYTRVHLGAAVVGGITAAVLWQLAGMVFAALVAGSASYSAIYSSFAVLILSLIWLQVAWLVVLIGGRVAYVCQHPTSYASGRGLGPRMRERIGLAALVEVTGRYLSDAAPYRVEELAAVVGAPVTVLEDLVDIFVARGVLARAARPDGVTLVRPPEHVMVVDILDAVAGAVPPNARSQDVRASAVADILRKRDEVLRDALRGVTLRSLASTETSPPDATVADLAQYRRR